MAFPALNITQADPTRPIPIEAEGFRFFYRVYENPRSRLTPLFIFNGFLQTMNSWIKYIRFFQKDSAVITADLPGAGNADTIPKGAFDLNRLADCVLRIVDSMDAQQIDIISASSGASVSYAFTRTYPERVRHLALGGVTHRLEGEAREAVQRGVRLLEESKMHDFAHQVIEMLLNTSEGKRIGKHALVRQLLYNQLRRLPEAERMRHIVNAHHLLHHPELEVSLPPSVKKLVFTGEYDRFTPPEAGRRIASQLPNTAFTTIRGADHLAHIEQRETLLALLSRFLRDEPLDSLPGINPVEYY
jgi:pimeloyl-ACP methyl ester carboxylesterase